MNKATENNSNLIKLFNTRQPIEGVHTIATHPSCHLDEIGGMYLLQNTDEGRSLFPGIEKAVAGPITETELRDNDYMGFHGFIKALEKGILIIGVGAGPFDEHSDRDKKISCIELIKRYLDLFHSKENREIYGKLIKFINFEDNNGDNLIENINKANPERKLLQNESDAMLFLNLGMLAQNIKKGWDIADSLEEQRKNIQMAYHFFKNETGQRRLFLQACTEYKKGSREIVNLPNDYAMVLVKSDNKLMTRAVRNENVLPGARKLGITMVYKTNGQFILIPHNGFKDKMIEVIKVLRQKLSFNRSGKGLSFKKIGEFGTVYEIPEIYFDENMKIIMNGSKTDPNVPGLIDNGLSVDDIIDAVQIGLDTRIFSTQHTKKCEKGICSKNEKTNCSLFCYNLARCVEIREKRKEEEVAA